jgi:hypothetical protein
MTNQITPEVIKAVMEVNRKDMESLAESIFESIQVLVDANRTVAESFDARITLLESKIKELESSDE